MPMAQRQQQHQHFRQQQQQQQQQHQQQQQKEEERLNPQAPMWIPKGGDAITMPTTVFPPFYPFAPPMSPYWGVAPVPSPVRPIAGYSIFSHTMGTGIPFPSPEQQAWIEARGNYLSSFQNLYMNRQPPSGVEREGYVNVPPLTVPFFQSGTFLRPNVGTVLATLPPASDLTRRDVMSQDLSTQKREGDVPQAAYQVESKVDVKNIEVWHRYLSESCSSCLLCGEDGHRYTSCRLFDGKSVCFVHIPTSYVYVMHHMHWIEGAKLRDVYFFIQNAMGLLQDQVVLFFNNQTIIFTDFSPETRCCDLQLLPGAIVGVSDQNLCIEEKLSSSMKQEMSLTRKSVQEVHPIGEKEAQTDVTFDVSTIARSSELSVSIPVAERRTKYPLEHTMEEISGSVSPTNKGDSTISFMARKSDEEEKSPMSIGDETAVPSSQTSKSGTVLSEGRDPILVTDSSQNSAFPFPNITTGITLRVNAPTMQGTLCGDGTLLDWATVSHDDKSSGMEERTPHMDSTITGVAVKDVVLSPSQTEDAAAEELRRRRTVHVKFIPVTMPFSAIRALLWSCGEVNKVRLVRPRTTAHPERTFYVCFAEYADDAGAARMIALHGCRVAGNFRLAVARSRDAIRGGFITDRDLNTGRPCTFGLNAVQIRQLGIPITTPPIVPPPPPPPTTTTTARAVIPPAREIMPLPPFSSLPKGPFPKLIIQEKREKGSGSSTIDPTEDISTKVEGGGSGDYVGRGPYTLEIVSAVEARKVQQQNPSLGGSGVEGSANVLSVAPRTQPVMKPFPEVASREALKRVEALRASLREAVLNHLRHRSSESFYNAFTLLEELRWSAVTALFHLELAVFEVLLFLNQDKVILSKDLQSCAYAAVRLGNELRQILQSVASNNSCIAPMWRLLFTTTPLAEQQEQEYGVVESEFEMAELQGSCDVSPIYPFLPNCLRFVELLLYIAVLLDISHKKRMLRCDKAETETETKGAALALLLPPQVNPLHEVESELLFSARRLLMQLQLEFSTEKGVSASTKCTWVDKVTSILQKIPSTGDWPDGNLIELFSTDLPKGSQDILLESVDFHLFCWV
ncbi:hypothetical protein LSM04_009655 [Trypanosoma melophagium]|uniref:uncharacterized protein n=1 Tax=Trypanosoma melophagium TaxID=715481 RepID=UPI00351A0A3D|nr:hypothetical protein LSM04_009655 [Trypanosoma melophagium]